MTARPRFLDAVKACAADGYTMREAAERLCINYSTVFRYRHEFQIHFMSRYHRAAPRKTSDPRSPLMAALYRDGYTLAKIGEQYGLTRERVRQILMKYHGIRATDGGIHKAAAQRRAKRDQRLEAECLAYYGCSRAQLEAVREFGRQAAKAGDKKSINPLVAYKNQKGSAAWRGIPWELNFWQWWTIWQESGHWHERGRGAGFVMCRVGDEGPYAVGNVFIATGCENSSDRKGKKSGLPIGVQVKNGRYFAHRRLDGRNVYLGAHATPELAHAAYLAAAPTNGVAA